MAKNSKGGSRHKRAKNSNALQAENLVLREDETVQHYAYVKKSYGNGWFGVFLVCSDGETLSLTTKEYRARVSGRMRKQKWRNFVRIGGLVLICKRDFQTNDDKVDIVHVYKDDAVRKLVKMGEVPSVDNIDGDNGVELSDTVVFVDDAADEDATDATEEAEEADKSGTAPLDTVNKAEEGDVTEGLQGISLTETTGEETIYSAGGSLQGARATSHCGTSQMNKTGKMGWDIDVDDI